MRLYVEHWPGPVTVAVERATSPDSNLDQAEWLPGDLPFELVPVSFDDRAAMTRELSRARLVAAGLDDRQAHLVPWARRAGAKIVYTSEYTLRTRWQIVRADTTNPLLRARRQLWAAQQELRYLRAVLDADGLQCNGLPTYALYHRLQRNSLLFFDTRTSAEMLISPAEVEAKQGSIRSGAPLRLAFSGRLNAMKGVDRLVDVASSLRRRGVPFTMDIWGGGSLETTLAQRIAANGLGDTVKLHGSIDFANELVPLVKSSVDLFVICHRQGDPSCTYLETLACGVPIVGFANEAWRGLARLGAFGWVAPMEDVEALADHVERLHHHRQELAEAVAAAAEFASHHTFERTFRERLLHLRRTAGL